MSKSYFFKRALFLFALLAASFSMSAQQFQSTIQTYLDQARSKWKLNEQDVHNWTVSDQYQDAQTGITHTYLHQQISGIRIYNAVSTMAIRDGAVVHFANRFYANAAAGANTSTPLLTPENAIQAAAAHLGVALIETPKQQTKDENRHVWGFNDCGISRKPVQVELLYMPVENKFRLAWNVSIAVYGSADWWNVRVDALTGAFLDKNNWTLHCDFGYGDASQGKTASSAAKQATATENNMLSGAKYNVFAYPLEAPSFGPRSLLTDPNSTVASPFGWHDTDGADGAEYTITRGNNVYAYEDRSDANQPGYSPDGGASLNFDFPLDLSLTSIENQDAIITNLFYLNNMLHDVLYHHGFDEASGNFQAKNYSNAGQGDDYVLAEAQDGGGTSNANFSTPNDGNSGTMQMYLWPQVAGSTFTVNTPAEIAGSYTAFGATFGPAITVPITSDIVLVDDGTAPATDACDPIINGNAIDGKIVVIDRGTCTFVSKVQAAEAVGALAVIVINNTGAAPFAMPGAGPVTIPSVMISKADGDLLKAQIAAGHAVNVTLNPSGAVTELDGSIDNGIVSHEYGHGLSTRLTGGPSNSNCLNNGEEGGEGWSDWLALMLTIEPGDAGSDSRGIGTYALGELVTDGGIRRYPYSTDMSINPQTYADLAVSGEVHDIGEIWAQVLWDMSWKIIDAEGFDPDWFNGNGGNNTAMKLVLEAMKLQPCGPGYVDGRDAILAADALLYNNAHRCMIWEAFAGRGLGANANQGSADVAGDETVDFNIPTFCQIAIVPPVASASVDVNTSCFGVFHFKDLSTDIPQAWAWDFGDGSTSDNTNPTHTYLAPGTYTVVLTVSNTLGTDTDTLSVSFATLPTPMVAGDTSVCAGNPAILTATVIPGYTADWSTGGTVVYTGTSFTTPALATTTTYAVRQLEDKPVQHVGPPDNTFGNGGNHNTGFDGRLLFEAFAPFRLLSVLVYAQGAGDRTFTLYAANTAIQTVTLNVPNGSSRITLNMDIPAAGNYSLGNVSENLYRNSGGANYPYVIDNLVRIYSSNATNEELARYYYFYDWEVQETTCASLPTTFTVNVKPGPVASFIFLTNGLEAAFDETSTGNATSWLWQFGDGTSTTDQNPGGHSYATPGVYDVQLTISDGNCSSTFTQTLYMGVSGVNNADGAFGLQVFPNPASDQLNLEFSKMLSGPLSIDLTDVNGRLVSSSNFGQPAQKLLLNTSGLTAGIYNLRVTGKEGSVVRKVVIIR